MYTKKVTVYHDVKFFVFLTLEMCKRNIRAGESYEMSQIPSNLNWR